jgi:hypothetical protein
MTPSDRFGSPQPSRTEHKQSGDHVSEQPIRSEVREKTLDQTIADSFPTSDPPSSIPDPSNEITAELPLSAAYEQLTQGLPAGSWAAISLEQRRVVGTGATRQAAIDQARRAGHSNVSAVRVAEDPEAPGKFRDLAS